MSLLQCDICSEAVDKSMQNSFMKQKVSPHQFFMGSTSDTLTKRTSNMHVYRRQLNLLNQKERKKHTRNDLYPFCTVLFSTTVKKKKHREK